MGRRVLSMLLLVTLLLLPGCGGRSTPMPAPKSPEQGALEALTAYLEARRSGAMADAYGLLTSEAKAAFTQQEMVDYYAGVRSFTWARLGEPKTVDEDWVRIIVIDIEATLADGRISREPEHAYYLNRAQGRWGLALANPMVGRIGQLYRQNATGQEIYDAIGEILEVNPWTYRAHVEMFYLFMNTGDMAAAGGAIENLYRIAVPADLPEINALRGEYQLELAGRPDEASASLTLALEMGTKYPERYGDSWRSLNLSLLGQALMALEEDEPAQEAALESYRLNPDNEAAKQILAYYGISLPK